jgi:predicted PurR-regulated permease PerM
VKLGHWIGIFVLVISLYILWQIRNVLMLIFAAVVLATALNTLARQMQKLGMRRSVALVAGIVLVISGVTIALWLVVPAFITQFEELTQLVPQGIDRLNGWLDQLRNSAPRVLEPYLPDINSLIPQLQPVANQLLSSSFTFLSGTLGNLLNIVLVIVLTLMMLADPDSYRNAFVRCFPSFYRRRIQEILDKSEAALRGWMIGILFNMLVIGTFSGLGLLILGVRLPLANGIFAGLLTFIPNIGPALSVIPPVAIALLDAPWKSIAVLILYFAVQQLETNVLTPYVMAQQVSLLPAVTLLSQVFFATFFGFVGLLLALPLTVVGQVWLQEILVKDVLDQWQTTVKLGHSHRPIMPPHDLEALVALQQQSPDLSMPMDETDSISAIPQPHALKNPPEG